MKTGHNHVEKMAPTSTTTTRKTQKVTQTKNKNQNTTAYELVERKEPSTKSKREIINSAIDTKLS